MATITAAARTIYPYDASLDDEYARAKEQLDDGDVSVAGPGDHDSRPRRYLPDASLREVSSRAQEQLDEAAPEDLR